MEEPAAAELHLNMLGCNADPLALISKQEVNKVDFFNPNA